MTVLIAYVDTKHLLEFPDALASLESVDSPPLFTHSSSDLPSSVSNSELIQEREKKSVLNVDLIRAIGPYVPEVVIAPLATDMDKSVQLMLSDRVRSSLDLLLPWLSDFLSKHNVKVKSDNIGITGFVDLEEGEEQVVVSLEVMLPDSRVMGFWDFLGQEFGGWAESLDDSVRITMQNRISVEVWGGLDESAI